ncbi:MAG: polysaccharide biosynthesis/export family protein [Thermodesulfobacteriota bacterium]|nr:polysaccharide biosynthesis/export family protein [Thermodesulfobacteriota bacterium]
MKSEIDTMEEELIRMSQVKKNSVFTEEFQESEYIIGPKDVLEISLWEDTKEVKYEMTVRSDGNISVSFLENVRVVGLTARQVDKAITEKLTRFVKNPRVDVLIKGFNSKRASLLGEVQVLPNQYISSGPGSYPLQGKTTLLDLLIRAGGATTEADLKRARLIRNGKTYILNLYKAMFEGDISQNIILDSGDVVIIPELPTTKDKVFVLGEIKGPGAYSFKHEIDLITVISMAGGCTYDAVKKNILIIRGYPIEPEILVSNLNDFLSKGDFNQNISLKSGDVVYVPRNFISNLNYYFSKLTPILDLLLYPGQFRDMYTTGGGLRIDTGTP